MEYRLEAVVTVDRPAFELQLGQSPLSDKDVGESFGCVTVERSFEGVRSWMGKGRSGGVERTVDDVDGTWFRWIGQDLTQTKVNTKFTVK